MKFRAFIFQGMILLLIIKSSDCTWDYERFGPDVWSKSYPQCAGQRQSPVNIRTACTIKQNFERFYFMPNPNTNLYFMLQNDGHTITAKNNGSPLYLSGANLSGDYRFANFHLHWGPNENVGSEHQVNGIKYTGEVHFVFENVQTNDMAVLGFFLKSELNSRSVKRNRVDDARVAQWHRYFNATQSLTKTNDSVGIELNLSLLMGINLVDFWRYNGSLTIPPCSENVIWTIFKEPIYLYNYEFDTFRHDLLFESYRGPQPLYQRHVYRSFQRETLSPIPDENCCPNKQSQGAFNLPRQSYIYLCLFHLILTWCCT